MRRLVLPALGALVASFLFIQLQAQPPSTPASADLENPVPILTDSLPLTNTLLDQILPSDPFNVSDVAQLFTQSPDWGAIGSAFEDAVVATFQCLKLWGTFLLLVSVPVVKAIAVLGEAALPHVLTAAKMAADYVSKMDPLHQVLVAFTVVFVAICIRQGYVHKARVQYVHTRRSLELRYRAFVASLSAKWRVVAILLPHFLFFALSYEALYWLPSSSMDVLSSEALFGLLSKFEKISIPDYEWRAYEACLKYWVIWSLAVCVIGMVTLFLPAFVTSFFTVPLHFYTIFLIWMHSPFTRGDIALYTWLSPLVSPYANRIQEREASVNPEAEEKTNFLIRMLVSLRVVPERHVYLAKDLWSQGPALLGFSSCSHQSCEVSGTRLELRFRSTHQLAKQPSFLVFQSLESQYIREAIWYLKNGTYMDASLRQLLASPRSCNAEQDPGTGGSHRASVLMFFADTDSLRQRIDACCRVIGCENLVECNDRSSSRQDEASASNVMINSGELSPMVLTNGLCVFHASCLSLPPSEALTRQKSRDKPPVPKLMQPLITLLQSTHYARTFKFQGQLLKRQNAHNALPRDDRHAKRATNYRLELSAVYPPGVFIESCQSKQCEHPTMHAFDVVTLYRTWTFAAMEPEQYEIWLHVLTECVEKHATIASDKILRFPVKLAMTGQTCATEATSLEISSHGVSFCTGHEAEVVLSTWYYTDLEKWSVVFQQGYLCCLLKCRSPAPASPGSSRTSAGDTITQDFLFRTTEASTICLAIEFYVGKCMAKLEVLAGKFLEETRVHKSERELVTDPAMTKRGSGIPKLELQMVREHPIETVSLAPVGSPEARKERPPLSADFPADSKPVPLPKYNKLSKINELEVATTAGTRYLTDPFVALDESPNSQPLIGREEPVQEDMQTNCNLPPTSSNGKESDENKLSAEDAMVEISTVAASTIRPMQDDIDARHEVDMQPLVLSELPSSAAANDDMGEFESIDLEVAGVGTTDIQHESEPDGEDSAHTRGEQKQISPLLPAMCLNIEAIPLEQTMSRAVFMASDRAGISTKEASISTPYEDPASSPSGECIKTSTEPTPELVTPPPPLLLLTYILSWPGEPEDESVDEDKMEHPMPLEELEEDDRKSECDVSDRSDAFNSCASEAEPLVEADLSSYQSSHTIEDPDIRPLADCSDEVFEDAKELSSTELEVLKCILVREGYLQRLGRASAAGHIGGAHLGETIDVLDLLRLATLETVEAIVAWRGYKQKNKANDKLRSQVVEPEQFKWNGINYLLKLASDLGFLGKHTGLIEWLGFTLQRNPFILPLNLDCRAKLLQNSQPTGKTDSADSDRFLQVGGKRSRSTLGNSRSSNGGEDAETLAQALAERKRAKTPYEIRVVNDEELVPNSLSKTGAVRPKTRTPLKAVKAKYSSVLPSQIGEVDMARLHEAEIVVLQEEAAFGRYTRDIHGRVVPEDEALRRFSMVELSGNVYNVPATLKSSYAAEDPEGNELRLGDPSHSDIPGKFHAKKRSGMLGPIFKPEWRSFERPPPPRRRARGAQLEETLAAERKANAQLGVLLDLLREETERKAMDVAYFESCAELQGYSEELRAFTTQAQRELVILWKDLQEKKYMYENKIANIHKKEELLNTFKVQHQAVKDATHAERIESSRTNVVSRNQEQQRREDQEQAAVRTAAAAERHEHEQATPVVEHFCATQIQKIVRGMLARELFAQMKIEFVVASTFIQAAVRGFLVRRRVAKMYWHNAASVHIQRVARGFIARKLATEKRRRRLEIQSAERIQKVVRGRFGRVRMTKIRELVSWRLQLALAARSMNAVALQELANACQAMVALPNLMRTEAKATSEEKPLPALVLGLVRVLMIFTSDADNEWDIPNTRWRVAARFLRCGVGVTRRMQKIADAAAGAARAWMSPSGGFAAAGVAASTPYLRESVLGTALLDACKGDLDFRVDTFERIPRGWQAAVAIFKWTTAFCAISRLQHLVESSTNDLFLVVSRTLSKREAQHELTERRDADHSDEMLARRFVPVELVQTHGYPFHRPRPLLLVVANDVPRKARAVILEKLQVALPGLFLTITRPPATAKRSLGVQDPSQTFDFKTIRDALALGHSVILEGDVGLRGVTQRAFLSSFATVKHGLHPVPMCVLLRGTITNRSDLFGPKQGSDMEEEAYREEIVRRMVDADFKLALDRTTRLRLELADDSITHEMEEQAKSGDLSPAPSPALVVVMEAVLVLLTPGKVYEGPSQSEIATSSVSWRLSRRLLAQPAFLRAKLQQVDVTTIPPVNLVALERYLRHSWWPNAAVPGRKLILAGCYMLSLPGSNRLHEPLVVVFNNCPTDSVQDGAGEDSAVMELMDAVLADVRVYRTAHLLVSSRGNVSTRKRKKKTNDEEARCVVTLFHECRLRIPGAASGERLVFTLVQRHEDGEFQAAFYAPRSSTRHTVRLPRDVAEELLHLPRHATPSSYSTFFAKVLPCEANTEAHDDSVEDSDGGDQELVEEADTMIATVYDDALLRGSRVCFVSWRISSTGAQEAGHTRSDGSTEVSVVSCTCMLDDRDAESDDDDDDGEETELQRKTYSYDTEELVHRGSYHVNGLYVVTRVTMRAQVLRDLQPALVSPTDRVRERDSFTIKFCVYHPASSGATMAEIHGHRDLREVVGPDKSALISSTSLDTLMRHIILTRLDAQVDHESSDRLEVTFLRDRLYAKQKATPVTKMFERDSGVNAVKLIDEARRHGIAGERGVKVLTTAKVVSGCGRTLFTVFDIAASHQFGQDQSFVRLRVDAYVCATSARLSLLLESSDLVHVVGDEDQELLLPIAHNDANTAEVAEMEEDRSRRLAIKVLDHLRVEQRSDGRGDRLVLSDFSFSMPHHDEAKTVRLFKTIRVVGHDQVLLSVYLDEGSEASSLSLRLELYDPASSSRCTLKLSHSTLSAILGIPASLELDQVVNEILKESDRANLMTHICSLLHVEKVSATSDGVLDRPSAFTMSLLFDEQRALECMRQHINHSGGIAADTAALPQCSWTGVTTSTDGKYLSVHLQLQSTQKDQRWLVCSAFAPAELLVSARKFEWVDIPAELLPILSENTETNDQPTSSVYSLFFSKVCEQLRLEVQYHDEGGHESEQEIQENHSSRPKAITIALQRSDGHIQLEFAAEDAINLQPPQPSNARSDQIQSLESLRQESDMPNKKLTADGDTDELLLIPPLMNICILIVGTRGDVQPFLAIALRLQEDGHRVRLATHAVYRDFVMSHGIEFYPLGGDPKELAAYMVKTGGNLIPMKIKTLTEDGPGVPGPPFRAQAIIANPVSYGHVHVAERLGVPLHIMFPQPWVPTMAFPHPLSNLAYTGKWQKRNYLSYKLVDMIMWQGTEGVINEFRTEVLKLHPIRNGDSGSELLLDLSIPHSFMWSPQLVPKPSDWGDLYDVIGTVTLKGPASEYSPSPELEAFLGNDGGPIFVGFGSMVLADPLATTKMIIEAATHAKMRVLIQSSWTDMAGDIDIPGNVFFLGNCPHDWLMPRVSAVVHHGGAGTTAAGLLAGKPTFIVPFFGDQPFWGQAVMSTRVGVPPCPIAQLTTEILHNAFVELANPDLRKRAEAMRDLMLREDGAGEAVRKFYHHLPTQDMWCDLDHQRIAMQWTVHDRIKLCDRCAFIIRERPENHKKKFVRYHCVDYSARGPSSLLTGVATGAIVFAHELTGGLTGVLLQPARGLINGGVVGAVRGAVTGVYYLLVRPVHGAVLFADRAVAGRKNAKREEGHRKLNNVFDRHLMAALGVQDGLADTFCSATSPNAVDIVIFARRKDRKKMLGGCGTACMEKLLSPITPEGSSLHQQHKASVQPLVRRASSSTRSDTSAAVEATSSRTGSELAIKLRLARLTSAGTVRLTLGIPSESANAVDFSTIAEWEAYASSHVDTTEFMQQNTRSKRSKPANPRIPHMMSVLLLSGPGITGQAVSMTRDDLDKLLQNIDAAAAAPEQKVRIIFQTREIGDKKRAPYQSANVFQVPSDLEYARFFHERNVVAAIHWGEPDITAEALSAGKPVGICGTHSLQHFMACVCEQAQVGMPLIDWKTCTVKSLALNFAGLLKSELREIVKRLSTTFDREQPVNTAVKTFYAKLPLEAMRCDVDPSKLARVFDPPHKLKLSLPVYVAIRDKTKVFVPYKPLRFGGSLPPTFFILGTPVKVSHQAKPSRQFDAVRQTLDLLEATGILLDSRTFSCSSIVSNPGSLVATPEQIEMFWSSVEEEAEVRKATAVAYERLVKKPQRATKREAIMRFFRFRKSTQRREAEQLTSVE
ncbi:Glycosyltransferase family 28, N-terminal domain [Phytophthora cactorum]|nr:Glycosyltransferase family 28, N-terminal domain [Phytophthora cactorum]